MGLENPIHIALILIVVLLVFGAKRLPEMGRSLGEGLRGFKETISGDTPAPRISAVHVEADHATPDSHQEPAPLQPAA